MCIGLLGYSDLAGLQNWVYGDYRVPRLRFNGFDGVNQCVVFNCLTRTSARQRRHEILYRIELGVHRVVCEAFVPTIEADTKAREIAKHEKYCDDQGR